MEKQRCPWVNLGSKLYIDYHDIEWGKPVHDDTKLFEMLILEGAQAGLSWETILKKREGYRKAFKRFHIKKVSRLTDNYLEKQLENPKIVRNRFKVFSVRNNAKVALEIQKEFGSLDKYFWAYVSNKPLLQKPKNTENIPTKTKISDQIAKDLKKRGMIFVGSTTIYAFMQAVGMTNDHTKNCFKSFKRKKM